MLEISFIKMKPEIEVKYGSEDAAGLDLTAASLEEAITLQPGEKYSIGSGIKLHMKPSSLLHFFPKGMLSVACLVIPRSGAGSLGVSLANTMGLIDPDYQGEIIMKIRNNSNEPLVIEPNQRICQMFFVPTLKANLTEVSSFEEKTARGEGGFGSTGSH